MPMSGNPQQCRRNAARCLAIAKRAKRNEVRRSFRRLANTWKQLAAETESTQMLFDAISAMEFDEPYYALPAALKLRSAA